jgi:hypothetical protein
MNILLDDLPTSFIIDGRRYDFHYDYRVSIRFCLLMQNEELTDEEKIIEGLKLYYPTIPHNIEEAYKNILFFYSRGKEEIDNKKVKQGKRIFKRNNKCAYDFEVDSDLIFTAFMSQYNINLNREKLHWWEFVALFNSLSDSNDIVKIMNYRTIDLTSIEDKKERKMYSELQKYYSLEYRISKEEELLLEQKRKEWG